MTERCGDCALPIKQPDSGGYFWCSSYDGHWDDSQGRYLGGYCHIETPGCEKWQAKGEE